MAETSNMGELSAREKNRIISAVNCGQTPEQADLKTEAEIQYYRKLWEEARKYYEHGGIWPVFDLWELD